MKFYNLDTEFTFGRYANQTIRQVIEIQPSYLDWCAINLDHFYIDEEVINEIKAINPSFVLSEEGQNKLSEKYDAWENAQQADDYDHYQERHTYENYNGSYAQDVEGWSDQDIDDAFGGEPDAYWNID